MGCVKARLGGALLALLLMGLRLIGYSFSPVAWLQVLLVFVGTAVLGGLVGGMCRVRPNESARLIDQHYGLKDRILTALTFFHHNETDAVQRLQVQDAAEHVEHFDVEKVLPYRIGPKRVVHTTILMLIALGLTLIAPLRSPNIEVTAAPTSEVLAVGLQLQDELVDPLEELAEEYPDEPEIEELSQELQELLEEMEEVNVDPKEVLVKLSEMEAAIQSTMSAFQLEAMDTSLSELGESLSAAEATREAAKSLQDGDYSKGAKALEKMDASSMSKSERKSVAKKLAQTATSMRNRSQNKAADAVDQFAEGLQEGDPSQCQSAACQIAGICRKQGLRKGICKGLGCKLALLSMCKGQCSGSCNKNGGQSNNWSDSSKETWGRRLYRQSARRRSDRTGWITPDATDHRYARRRPFRDRDHAIGVGFRRNFATCLSGSLQGISAAIGVGTRFGTDPTGTSSDDPTLLRIDSTE